MRGFEIIASELRTRPSAVDLVRVGELLDADETGPDAPGRDALRNRDRALGRQLQDLREQPQAQVMAWLHERGGSAAHAADATATVATACGARGVLAGAATAMGAFFYDGAGRVNVLVLLALFVLLPLATLVLFGTAAASPRGLRGLNPGVLGLAAARLLPDGDARRIARLAGGECGPRIAKWLLLTWSQWMGLGFSMAAVITAVTLVVFTDLAFGWSTTLDLGADSVQRLCEGLALPWRAALSAAVPTAELVEASRYYRVAPAAPPPDPAFLGQWWSFVISAMLFYGVAPRVLTVILSRRRLATACEAVLLADPRVRDLLDRMNTPLVETRSPDPEEARPSATGAVAFAALPAASGWHAVNWAAMPLDETQVARLAGSAPLLGVHAAGGTRSTADDDRLVRELAAAVTRDHGVLVLARAWEPPTLDLMDFLTALRDAMPGAVTVAVLPVALSDGEPAAPSPEHASGWREALGRAGLDGVQAVRLHEDAAR